MPVEKSEEPKVVVPKLQLEKVKTEQETSEVPLPVADAKDKAQKSSRRNRDKSSRRGKGRDISKDAEKSMDKEPSKDKKSSRRRPKQDAEESKGDTSKDTGKEKKSTRRRRNRDAEKAKGEEGAPPEKVIKVEPDVAEPETSPAIVPEAPLSND